MPQAPTDGLRRRHAALRQLLATRGLDALLVTALPNVVYLTNFNGSTAATLVDRERVTCITDSRYVSAVESMQRASWACPDLTLMTVDGSYDDTIAQALAARGGGRVGFEAAHLTVSRHRYIESKLAAEGARAVRFEATEGL